MYFYLKGKTERESSNYWITPQMPTTAKAGQSPTWEARAQLFVPSSAACENASEGSWNAAERAGIPNQAISYRMKACVATA